MYGQDLKEGVYYYTLYINYDHVSDDKYLSGLYDYLAYEDFISFETSENGIVKFLGQVTIFKKE